MKKRETKDPEAIYNVPDSELRRGEDGLGKENCD